MRPIRAIGMLSLLAATLLLSGCSLEETPAVTQTPPTERLTFPSDTAPDQAPPPAPAPTPRTAPPTAPSVTDKPMYTTPPQMSLDQNKSYTATLTTSDGLITIALDATATPITVNNFVFLARDHFYDGTIFHRVIKDFMIQGGDPEGSGMGGPGYHFADEPVTKEYTRGTVAMANAGPDTNGSQFFIMHRDAALPKNYVIFGTVTDGMTVVDKIAESPVQAGASGEPSSPVTPVTVTTITITEK